MASFYKSFRNHFSKCHDFEGGKKEYRWMHIFTLKLCSILDGCLQLSCRVRNYRIDFSPLFIRWRSMLAKVNSSVVSEKFEGQTTDIQTRCPSIVEFEVYVRSHPQKKFSHASIFWKGLRGFVASEIKLEDDCQNTNLRDQSLIYCCPKVHGLGRATTTPKKV